MIPLASKTNVVAPNATYPYGRTKDNTGSNDGTPVNTAVHGDAHQFFEKLMDEAAIAPNGLPENEVDGWQLYEALLKVIDHRPWAAGPFSSLFSAFNADGDLTLSVPNSKVSFMINGGTLFYKLYLEMTVVDDGPLTDGTDTLFEIGFTINSGFETSETLDRLGDTGVVFVNGGTNNQGVISSRTDAANNLVMAGLILNRNVVIGNTIILKISGSWPLA